MHLNAIHFDFALRAAPNAESSLPVHQDLPAGSHELDEIEQGIDLSDYCRSTEWDLLAVPAKKYAKTYTCCDEPYPGNTTAA